MGFKVTSNFLKYIVPISLAPFVLFFFMKKNKIDYVSVEIDDLSELEIESTNKENPSITQFKLRPFVPEKNEQNSSLSALSKNPFRELGTIENSYDQFPNDLKFTGILKVGDKEGVFISSNRGLDVFYSGQEISKGYKIISIDSKKAEIILTNGLSTKLVKLEQD